MSEAVEASKQRISRINEDLLSRIAVREFKTDHRIRKLEKKIEEAGNMGLTLEVRFEEFRSKFPTPAETRSASVSAVKEMPVVKSRDRKSGMEVLKTTKNSVLV